MPCYQGTLGPTMRWQDAPIGEMFDPRERMDNYSSRLITDNIKGRKPYEIEVVTDSMDFGDMEIRYGFSLRS